MVVVSICDEDVPVTIYSNEIPHFIGFLIIRKEKQIYLAMLMALSLFHLIVLFQVIRNIAHAQLNIWPHVIHTKPHNLAANEYYVFSST